MLHLFVIRTSVKNSEKTIQLEFGTTLLKKSSAKKLLDWFGEIDGFLADQYFTKKRKKDGGNYLTFTRKQKQTANL